GDTDTLEAALVTTDRDRFIVETNEACGLCAKQHPPLIVLAALAIRAEPIWSVVAIDLHARHPLEGRARAVAHLDFADEPVSLDRQPVGAGILLEVGIDSQNV